MFDRWVHKCKDAEEKLQNLGETNVSDNIDTVDGAKSSIEVVEVIAVPFFVIANFLVIICLFLNNKCNIE